MLSPGQPLHRKQLSAPGHVEQGIDPGLSLLCLRILGRAFTQSCNVSGCRIPQIFTHLNVKPGKFVILSNSEALSNLAQKARQEVLSTHRAGTFQQLLLVKAGLVSSQPACVLEAYSIPKRLELCNHDIQHVGQRHLSVSWGDVDQYVVLRRTVLGLLHLRAGRHICVEYSKSALRSQRRGSTRSCCIERGGAGVTSCRLLLLFVRHRRSYSMREASRGQSCL